MVLQAETWGLTAIILILACDRQRHVFCDAKPNLYSDQFKQVVIQTFGNQVLQCYMGNNYSLEYYMLSGCSNPCNQCDLG